MIPHKPRVTTRIWESNNLFFVFLAVDCSKGLPQSLGLFQERLSRSTLAALVKQGYASRFPLSSLGSAHSCPTAALLPEIRTQQQSDHAAPGDHRPLGTLQHHLALSGSHSSQAQQLLWGCGLAKVSDHLLWAR